MGENMQGLEEIWLVSEKEENEKKVGSVVRKKKMVERVNLLLNLFLVFAVFWAAIYMIDNKARIYELNKKNLELEKEVADLESQISEKNVLISSRFSLETVYETASKELGMIYPSSARVISLNANRYFTLEDTREDGPEFASDLKLIFGTKILKEK